MKNQELAAATREAEKLLREISDSTALAEKEKHKVAVIVEAVSKQVGGRAGGRAGGWAGRRGGGRAGVLGERQRSSMYQQRRQVCGGSNCGAAWLCCAPPCSRLLLNPLPLLPPPLPLLAPRLPPAWRRPRRLRL